MVKKNWLVMLALAVFGIFLLASPQNNVKALANGGYPFPNAAKCPDCQVDPWHFFMRQCTSYAAFRASQEVANFDNNMIGPNGRRGQFANALTWNDNAAAIGFTVSGSPQPGAIAVWESNQGQAGGNGHVAYVESVNGNQVNVSDYNWNLGDGTGLYHIRSFNLGTSLAAANYIILNHDVNSCTPPTGGGQTWTIANNCTISNSVSAPANVNITNNATLTLNSGAQINMDLKNYALRVSSGSKLILQNGSKIF